MNNHYTNKGATKFKSPVHLSISHVAWTAGGIPGGVWTIVGWRDPDTEKKSRRYPSFERDDKAILFSHGLTFG